MKQVFRIEGMHCVGCAMTIDEALESLKGVKSANTNYARQKAEVEYDDKHVTEAQIVSAIREAGYKVPDRK